MPEEINRIVSDHLSDLLFCPSRPAAKNLAAEGITRGVHVVGDVMADVLRIADARNKGRSDPLKQLGLQRRSYLLATVHRAENTDDPLRLRNILEAFDALDETVIFPVHPRTRKSIEMLGYLPASHVSLLDPVGYLDMVALEGGARMILTDSGGIQKEAYWLGVPCVTLRDETEWGETVSTGWNILSGTAPKHIVHAVRSFRLPSERPELYGDGKAALRILAQIEATNAANNHR